jgi:hypothetical protein
MTRTSGDDPDACEPIVRAYVPLITDGDSGGSAV